MPHLHSPVPPLATLRVAAAGLAAAWLALPPSPVAAQTAERVLYVSVTDEKGAPVSQVGPADVVVREDGVAREVLRVTPATRPMQVTLMVDNSQAATGEVRNLRDGLLAFVAALGPAHRVTLVTLGDRPTRVVEAAADAEALRGGIGRLFAQPGAGIYLLDGLAETAKELKRGHPPRPVIVSVTTEGVEFSDVNYLQALDALDGTFATYFAVVIRNGADAGVANVAASGREVAATAMRDRGIVLDRGTSEHGGERLDLLTGMALADTLGNLAKRLTQQVEVTYARPVTLIPPEKVTVSAARPGWKARGVPARPEGAR